MTRDLRPAPASHRAANPLRRLTLRGSREEALAYLPALCDDERLELADGRISLVAGSARVDVNIVAETGEGSGLRGVPLVSLELAFEGRSEQDADAFVRRYRHRARIGACCH